MGSLSMTEVGHVKVGEPFQHEKRYERDKLSVQIDGTEKRTMNTRGLDSPKSYLKSGNYNQGDGVMIRVRWCSTTLRSGMHEVDARGG